MSQSQITSLANYITRAIETPLPEEVAQTATHHILDTIAACVSGRMLAAGIAGARLLDGIATAGRCVVIGDSRTANRQVAALANAMAAHADESDDTHELSKSHPGCSIVPSALATAEELQATGTQLLRAVVLGYDIGCRVNMALWPSFVEVRRQRWGTPGISGMFGSASAAAALSRIEAASVRTLLSYVAQQASGMNTWKRDVEHVEKAYVMGGWPAYGALFALSLVEHGWSGVGDVFSGDPNFLDIVGNTPDETQLTDELGERFEIQRTHIKLHPVGSPAQAPIQGLTEILEDAVAPGEVSHLRVTLPAVLAHTVQRSRSMPNINLQYLLSTVLEDGAFSYVTGHDQDRFDEWNRNGGDPRITIVADDDMEPRRQALVEVTTNDGRHVQRRIHTVQGSPENPLSEAQVRSKAVGLIGPAIGGANAELVADMVLDLASIGDISDLTALLGRDVE